MAAEIEAYEFVAAPQVSERRARAEQAQRRLLDDSPGILEAAQHVAADALGRIAHGRDAVRRGKLGDDFRNAGQHVDVLMAVEVIDRDSRRTHAPDLLVELAADLRHRNTAA